MPHISYSELKDWVKCSFYHKLTRVDKLDGFKGNEFTAFGTAIHEVCEKKLLKEEIDDEGLFIRSFNDSIANLGDGVSVDSRLVDQMVGQGKRILPEIEEAVKQYFGEYKVLFVEVPLMEPIDGEDDYRFKGFVDAVVQTPDGKVHIFDWKSCSWGWNARRRADPMTTYQLTLYKHFFAQKQNIDPANIETHFALLKRTAKKDRVEFFRVTSGPQKTANALSLLGKALTNIKKQNTIKNKLSCSQCSFYKTEHCT